MDCPQSAPPAGVEEDKREEGMKPGREQPKEAIGKEDLELLEEPYQGLEDLCWSVRAVEQAVYLSLPAWIQGAMLCDLLAPLGLAGIRSSFSARLLSYMLLPYMLPATVFISASHRILWHLSKLPECALCLWRSLRQTVPNAVNVASSCLRRLQPPVPCATDPSIQAEHEHSDQTNLVGRRSLLHMRLSRPDLHSPVDPITDTISYSFLFNLTLGMGGQPNAPFPPNTRPILLAVEFNSDVEVEAEKMGNGGWPGDGTSPRISVLELENVYDEEGAMAGDAGEEKP